MKSREQLDFKNGSFISYLNGLKYEMSEPCSCTSDSPTKTHHVDILILGAGLAGLGAATAINASKKCSYLMVEAQSKAGGRVQTMPLNTSQQCYRSSAAATLVDAGAQWLHGKHNYLYHLSEKYQLLDEHQSEEGLGMYTYAHANEIDPFLVRKIDFHIGTLLSDCENFARTKTKRGHSDYPESVGHFLRERFQSYIDGIDDAKTRQIANDLFNWHMRFQIIDNSCLSWDQLSARYWGKYSFNGESCQAHYNFINGFGSLVDRLVDELDAATIFYNKEVHEIRIHDNRNEPNNNNNHTNHTDKSTIKHNRSDATISVKCTDGTVYTANHVLVTFSLGVLKAQHTHLFAPALPASIGLAIDSIGFGAINKIFLDFDAVWWDDLDGIQLIFGEHEMDGGQMRRASWTRHMTGFDVMKPTNPTMLLGWVGGQGAIDMEQLSDTEIISDCVDLLTKFTNIPVPYPTRFYWYVYIICVATLLMLINVLPCIVLIC